MTNERPTGNVFAQLAAGRSKTPDDLAALRAMGWRTIAEASEIAGLNPKAIRHWESAGLVQSKRSDRGWRLYSPTALYRINFIARALRVGMNADQITYMLSVRGTPEAQLYIAILEQRAQTIAGLINDLRTEERGEK